MDERTNTAFASTCSCCGKTFVACRPGYPKRPLRNWIFRMNTYRLLQSAELPVGFVYPHAFRRITMLELTNLEPWHVIEGDILKHTITGLRKRYPNRSLIPFARRQDNDDIACWDQAQGEQVCIIHDFAAAGWEQRQQFQDFWAWFRKAVEDMIEFDS